MIDRLAIIVAILGSSVCLADAVELIRTRKHERGGHRYGRALLPYTITHATKSRITSKLVPGNSLEADHATKSRVGVVSVRIVNRQIQPSVLNSELSSTLGK